MATHEDSIKGFRTHDELRARYIDKLGDRLGTAYHELWGSYYYLRLAWSEFVKLYGNQTRLDIANAAGGLFFKLTETAVLDGVLLALSRLTDPQRVSGEWTVSLHTARSLGHEQLPSEEDRHEIDRLIMAAQDSVSFARDWRNRQIGHRSLDLALGNAKPLEPATKLKVEEAMKAVFDVLNFLAQRLLAEELYDGPPVGSDGGTVPMLQVLRDGLKVKAERAERLRSGNWEITDIRQEPI